jgi:hypothetical protein
MKRLPDGRPGRRPDGAMSGVSSAPATSMDDLVAVGASLSTHSYAHRRVAASAEVIRVLLADDHALARAGVKAILSAEPFS